MSMFRFALMAMLAAALVFVSACGTEGPEPERTGEAVGGGLSVADGGAGGEGGGMTAEEFGAMLMGEGLFSCSSQPGNPQPQPPASPQTCDNQAAWAAYWGALNAWAKLSCSGEQFCPYGVYSSCILSPLIANIKKGNGDPCECLPYSECVYSCQVYSDPARCVDGCKTNPGPSRCAGPA